MPPGVHLTGVQEGADYPTRSASDIFRSKAGIGLTITKLSSERLAPQAPENMITREEAPESAEGLIGIRTRRGTLLQGATGAQEENFEPRAGEQGLAPPLEENAGLNHRELPPTRDPSGEAAGTQHVPTALALPAPEHREQAGGNILREALASSARSLEQMASLTPLRSSRLQNMQGNHLPRAAERLEEREGIPSPFQEGGLRNRAGGRDLADETDSQFTLQGWLPRPANQTSRREFGLQDRIDEAVAQTPLPQRANSGAGNASNFAQDWEEFQQWQKFQQFQENKKNLQVPSRSLPEPIREGPAEPVPVRSDSAQASTRHLEQENVPPRRTESSELAIQRSQEPAQRPRTTERLWQEYGRPRDGEQAETFPFEQSDSPPKPVPIHTTMESPQVYVAPREELRETSPPPRRPPAPPPDHPPSPGGSDGIAPSTPRREERRREDRFTEDPEGSRRTPRLFQPIKIVTFKGTKKEEGFGAHGFIKRMETYLRNTPGLTQGQMGLTLFHNLGEGAHWQDWIQSADDAYMDKFGDSLLNHWDALKEKFLARFGKSDPAESTVKLGQVQQGKDEAVGASRAEAPRLVCAG